MNIDLYGDSTQRSVVVWGGVSYQNSITPAVMLQMLLDRKFGAGVHRVRNFGIGGSTLAGVRANPSYDGGKTLFQHIASEGADVVVANWGINEAFEPGYNTNHHLWNYQATKSYVEGLGKMFFFETPNPIMDNGTGSHMAGLRALTDSVLTISGLKVVPVLSLVENEYPSWSAHLDEPKIHPNSIMATYIGEVLFNSIEPNL